MSDEMNTTSGDKNSKISIPAVVSLLLGIGAFLGSPAGFGAILGVPGVVLGHVAKAKIKRSNKKTTGGDAALVGLIMSYASIALALSFTDISAWPIKPETKQRIAALLKPISSSEVKGSATLPASDGSVDSVIQQFKAVEDQVGGTKFTPLIESNRATFDELHQAYADFFSKYEQINVGPLFEPQSFKQDEVDKELETINQLKTSSVKLKSTLIEFRKVTSSKLVESIKDPDLLRKALNNSKESMDLALTMSDTAVGFADACRAHLEHYLDSSKVSDDLMGVVAQKAEDFERQLEAAVARKDRNQQILQGIMDNNP
jgi:hypothetical protein